MKTIMYWLKSPLAARPTDVRVANWSGILGGLAQLGIAAVFFFRYASSAAELLAGLVVALIVCGLAILCGLLTGRVDWVCKAIPAHARWREFAGYGVGLVILPLGFWYLTTFSLERAGMTIGLLSVLGLSLAAICVGAWSTLRLRPAYAPVRTGL